MKRLILSLSLVALIMLTYFGHAALDDETILLYLSFDEGTGNEVRDQSQYGNHGEIINNTEWVDGPPGFGRAVEISGENTDCVVVPGSDSLRITGEITMMAWINSPGWAGSGDQWIDKNCHNGGELNSYGMGVFGDGTRIDFFLGSGGARPALEVNQTPAVNEWEHVAGTYDGKTMKTYLNGEVIGERDEAFDFQGTNDSDFRVGCSKDRANYTFNGAIDEVIIYSRALDGAEINQVMNSGLGAAVSPSGKLATTWANIK